jgi:hypothetical protein
MSPLLAHRVISLRRQAARQAAQAQAQEKGEPLDGRPLARYAGEMRAAKQSAKRSAGVIVTARIPLEDVPAVRQWLDEQRYSHHFTVKMSKPRKRKKKGSR